MSTRFSITLTQLTYFAECAKTLNMTAASQQLHVAQSAVSTAISHLERALDTTLFIRQHSKGLVLTPAGEQLLRDTQQVFGLLNDSIDAIRSDQDEVRGSISVACFNTLAPFLLPPLIGRLQERHPHLDVEFIEGDNEETMAALRGGRAELAITYQLTKAEGIAHSLIGEVPPHIIVPADHPLADRREVALVELTNEPFVLLNLPDSRDYFMSLLRAAGIDTAPKYRTSSYETVRSMVATGLGFGLLNQRPLTSDTYTGGHLATLEISDSVPGLKIAVSSLAQITPSARARAVADMAREIIAEHYPAT